MPGSFHSFHFEDHHGLEIFLQIFYFAEAVKQNKTKQNKWTRCIFQAVIQSERSTVNSFSLPHSLLHAHTHFFANNAHTNTHAHSLLSPNTNIFFSLGKLTCPSHTLALAYTSSLLFLSHSFKQCLCFNVSLSLQLFLSSRSLIHMLALLLLFHAV